MRKSYQTRLTDFDDAKGEKGLMEKAPISYGKNVNSSNQTPHSNVSNYIIKLSSMKFEKVGNRGLLFSFDNPYFTNVHVILGNNHIFVLDTFLGNDSMNLLMKTITEEGYASKPIIVFNSHADYDHYWGNGAFKDATIIGHELCKARVLAEGEESLVKYADHQRGEIELIPPNRTFHESLMFKEEGVKFFHTPGHTLDSASCFDEKDGVLFVGDNVESPVPYLNHVNFDQYIQTLKSYLEYDWKYIVTGHDPIMEKPDLIKQNIDYLRKFRDWSLDIDSMSTQELHRHVEHNLNTIKEELMKSEQKESLLKHMKELEKYIS